MTESNILILLGKLFIIGWIIWLAALLLMPLNVSESTSKALDDASIYVAEPIGITSVVVLFIVLFLEFKKQFLSSRIFYVVEGILLFISMISYVFYRWRCTNPLRPIGDYDVCYGIVGKIANPQSNLSGYVLWSSLIFLAVFVFICFVILSIVIQLEKRRNLPKPL